MTPSVGWPWGGSVRQEATVFPFVRGGLNHGFSILYTLAATAFAGFVPAVTVISEPGRFPDWPWEGLLKRGANSISKL